MSLSVSKKQSTATTWDAGASVEAMASRRQNEGPAEHSRRFLYVALTEKTANIIVRQDWSECNQEVHRVSIPDHSARVVVSVEG
jgi:hypothetical protein